MKKKIELDKLKIRIGDVEVELSLDEAKELREVMVALFPEKTEKTVERWYPWYPYSPWYITAPTDYNPYEFSTGDRSNTTIVSSGLVQVEWNSAS